MYFPFFKLKKWGKKDGGDSQTQLCGVALRQFAILQVFSFQVAERDCNFSFCLVQ